MFSIPQDFCLLALYWVTPNTVEPFSYMTVIAISQEWSYYCRSNQWKAVWKDWLSFVLISRGNTNGKGLRKGASTRGVVSHGAVFHQWFNFTDNKKKKQQLVFTTVRATLNVNIELRTDPLYINIFNSRSGRNFPLGLFYSNEIVSSLWNQCFDNCSFDSVIFIASFGDHFVLWCRELFHGGNLLIHSVFQQIHVAIKHLFIQQQQKSFIVPHFFCNQYFASTFIWYTGDKVLTSGYKYLYWSLILGL